MLLTDMLVVSDVDGTLLQASYGVPKENIDAIERFVASGGRFTVCTGRSVNSVRRYTEWIPFSAPAVLCNGAIIYDYSKDKQLYGAQLDNRVYDIVREVVKIFPKVGTEFHDCNGIVSTRVNNEVTEHGLIERIPFVVADIREIENRVFNKALFTAPPELIDSIQKFVDQRKLKDPLFAAFDYVKTGPVYFEIIPKGVNKGSGLRRLAEIVGVDIKNTVAIGDYYNDIDMFRAAGYTAAVADAPPEIRGMADITTQKTCLAGAVGELLESVEAMCGGYMQLKLDL